MIANLDLLSEAALIRQCWKRGQAPFTDGKPWTEDEMRTFLKEQP